MTMDSTIFQDGNQNATREAGGVSAASNSGGASLDSFGEGGAKAKCAAVTTGRVADAPLPFTEFDLAAAILRAQAGLGSPQTLSVTQ